MKKSLQLLNYRQRTPSLMVYVEKANKKSKQKPTQP
jgi:hypothetical protein